MPDFLLRPESAENYSTMNSAALQHEGAISYQISYGFGTIWMVISVVYQLSHHCCYVSISTLYFNPLLLGSHKFIISIKQKHSTQQETVLHYCQAYLKVSVSPAFLTLQKAVPHYVNQIFWKIKQGPYHKGYLQEKPSKSIH